MYGVRKGLLQFIFSGSNMRRWNDKLRPMELIEVDKQAHKMLTAWALFELNSAGLPLAERLALGVKIVEEGLFDFLYRLVITDIKPPVFYRIKENAQDYQELSNWVCDELEPLVHPLDEGFWQRFCEYALRLDRSDTAGRILSAAHQFSSSWEFNLIRPLNSFDTEFPEIAKSFEDGLNRYADIPGVPGLIAGSEDALGKFANLCGQLRFQKRWSQTVRIPETSVLGHMFIVAVYSYLFSLNLGASPARRLNNFFCGLVHDLPELLTRDIIAPVKRSLKQLPERIRQYEDQELERRVFLPLEQGGYPVLVERLRYLLGIEAGSEFAETIRREGHVQPVSFEDLQSGTLTDELDPKDGQLIKVCDQLAAFIEAHTSLSCGITSPHLQGAVVRIRSILQRRTLGPLHIGALIADFD